jgi:hypothetical protein
VLEDSELTDDEFEMLRDEALEAIADGEIDANVCELVRLINVDLGLLTHDSCGGHDKPNPALGGQPAGTWRVGLEIPHNDGAWNALAVLALTVRKASRDGVTVRLLVESNDPPRHPDFMLRGEGDPEAFAECASNVLAELGHPKGREG